jgi:GDP-L-fucose synthase
MSGMRALPRDARIFVAGHRGLAGSAIRRRLEAAGCTNLLLRTRAELDLEDAVAVRHFFETEKPEYVFLAAAKVGGILANDKYRADFLRANLAIQLNVIDSAYRAGVQKLLFLGTTCVYPKHAPQPMREDALLTGSLEPTNEAYAIAKISGILMCRSYNAQYGTDYISVMPTNLYGPGDNYDLQTSHVLPAMIRRFHEAKISGAPTVTLWGTGTPKREFLHVDDLADACFFLMERHDGSDLVNIGIGHDLEIRALAELVREIVGFEGEIVWDSTKPDGTPRKLVDVSKLTAMGWTASIGLREGITRTYAEYAQLHTTTV